MCKWIRWPYSLFPSSDNADSDFFRPSGGGDALPNPTALFHSIVVRFSPSTIAAIFWGHTHRDEKRIYYDFLPSSLSADGYRDTSKVDLDRPLKVGWLAPSITSLNYNPAWVRYNVNLGTYSVVDATTYYADISKASWEWESMDGRWVELYDARKAYDPQAKWPKGAALNATFWHERLAEKMVTESDVATKYKDFAVRYTQSGMDVYAKCTSVVCLQAMKCQIQAGSGQAYEAC